MNRRHYRHPPIQEAICEVRFFPGPPADLLLPLRLFERLKDEYGGPPRQQNLVEAAFPKASAGVPPEEEIVVRGTARTQLPSEDGRRILSVGKDVVSVSDLYPYSGWEEFGPRVRSALEAYGEVMDPKSVARVGLRYINRIVVAHQSFPLANYFTAPPSLPEIDGVAGIRGVFSRINASYSEGGAQLTTTFASAESIDDKPSFILDLDLSRQWDQDELPPSQAMTEVERLHTLEGQAFEAFITEEARSMFDAE